MGVFSEWTPVLLNSSWVTQRSAGNWVLWPVNGYRVLAPRSSEHGLNLFQRAVLGLCRAGVYQAIKQAELLCVSPDLAAVVCGELRQMGYIDAKGFITARGLEQLGELGEDRMEEPSVGWVFASALSGAWWSRFLPAHSAPVLHPHPASSSKNSSRVRLSFGTEGAPWFQEALRWEPGQAAPAPVAPTAQQILEVVRRQRRRASGRRSDLPWLQRIALVDAEASPFFLALQVAPDGSDYQVKDPFSGEPDGELEGWLRELRPDEFQENRGSRSRGNHALWSWLTGGTRQVELHQTLRELQQMAEDEVEQRLTVAIADHPDEKYRLVAMFRTLLEAKMPSSPADKWSDVLVKTQVVLEFLVKRFIPREKARRKMLVSIVPTQDRAAARALFEGVAAQVGFRVPLPSSLVSVQPGKVVAAIQQQQGSLRPLLLASLLASRESPEHPLFHAARRDPSFLEQLDRIAGLRDGAAHAGNRERSPEKDCQIEIESAVSCAFDATEALLLPHLKGSP